MPCLVFNRNIQHCHSAGRIYARPCNAIRRPVQKMHPKCIVRGTVGAAVLFGEMTNSRWGCCPWGKARETSIFGDGAESGMLQSSNHSWVPSNGGHWSVPKSWNPMGATRPITGVFRFSIPYISPINSNITFNPKKHTWNEENILMSGSSMENMI